MRIYKATYKDRDGKQQKSAKWCVDIFDHNQLRHKVPAFADKRLSEALGRNIEGLVDCRSAGQELDASQRYENGQDTRIAAILAAQQIPPRGVEPLLPG